MVCDREGLRVQRVMVKLGEAGVACTVTSECGG